MPADTNDLILRIRVVDGKDGSNQLKVVSQGVQQVGQASEKAEKSTKKLRASFNDVAGAFVGLLVAKKVAQGLLSVARAADEIQAGMAGIASVTDISTKSLDRLKSTILDVSEETGKAFGDVARATRSLIAQNLSPQAIEGLLGPLTRFQRVGDVTEKQATDLVVALGTMGVATQDTSAALDVMLKLANATALESKDFVDVLTRAGPAARVAGQSFAEMARSAALLRRGFQTGAVQGTSFNTLLNKMLDPKRQQFLRETFNVEVVDQFTGGLKPLTQILFELSEQVPKTEQGIGMLTQAFGPRAGGRVLATGIQAFKEGLRLSNGEIVKGTELMTQLQNEVDTAGGTVDKAFGKIMQNLGDQFNRLTVSISGLLGESAGPLVAALTQIVSLMADMAEGIRKVITAIPGFTTVISVVMALVGGFVALKAAQLGITAAFRIATVATNFMRTSTEGLNASLARTIALSRGAAGSLKGFATSAAASAAATSAAGKLTAGGAAAGAGGLARGAGMLGLAALPGLLLHESGLGETIGNAIGDFFFEVFNPEQARMMENTASSLEATSKAFAQAIPKFDISATLMAKVANKFEEILLDKQPTVIAEDVFTNLKRAGAELRERNAPGQKLVDEAIAQFTDFIDKGKAGIEVTTEERINFQNRIAALQSQIATFAGQGDVGSLQVSQNLKGLLGTLGQTLSEQNITQTRFREGVRASGTKFDVRDVPENDVVGIPIKTEMMRRVFQEFVRSKPVELAGKSNAERAAIAKQAAFLAVRKGDPDSISRIFEKLRGMTLKSTIDGEVKLLIGSDEISAAIDNSVNRGKANSLGVPE
jgi:TP901 family phage tail tape measure protein